MIMTFALSARWARFSLLVGALVAVGCGGGEKPAPRTHTVNIQGFVYVPSSLEVAVGDTIVWSNLDVVAHTVTADSGAFDSGNIAAGESWRYVATSAGSYSYLCTFHPTMKGMLVVR